MTAGGDEQARELAGDVARRSYGRLVAYLAGRTCDLAAAEDALADAFAAALTEWPRKGCPASPEAWLLTVARRKSIDGVRRRKTGETKAETLQLLEEGVRTAMEDAIPDRRLALLFACAHPALEAGVRAPLMLQVVLGLDAQRIASAFLTSPAAMGKRLVRAKEKIRQAGIPFSIPEPEELQDRVGAVLDALYAGASEGWSDPGGTDASRRELSAEVLYLVRVVADLLPREPEALGLLALLLHIESRRAARRSAEGEYVPFAEQNPELWDFAKIQEAEALLRRASAQRILGRYQLEAALQSAHVERRLTGRPNWAEVVQLYDALFALTGSTVVSVNRALALAEQRGAAAGLAALAENADDSRLANYQPYWAARAELLARTGAHAEAQQSYERAIGLEREPAVRQFLQRRQRAHAR